MPYSHRYIPGDRLYTCDVCGFDFRFSQMRKGRSMKQKGFAVCPDCYDPVHPNEDYHYRPRVEGKLKKVR